MTIGDAATAKFIHAHFNNAYYDGYSGGYKRAPNGFRRIGSGAYRVAYLHKASEVVYKLGDPDCNVREASNARAFRKRSTRSLGFEVRIPATRTYRMKNYVDESGHSYPSFVSAQEYAKGARPADCNASFTWMNKTPKCSCKRSLCCAVALNRLKDWTGLSDLHYNNVLIDKSDVFWIIDIAD